MKIQTFPQKLLEIMQIFFQIFFFQVLIMQSKLRSLHRTLNEQFFEMLFGCPTANFGLFSRGQPH